MQQRVRIIPSWTKSFVCQTTPHFDSTSRRISYSVHAYLTRKQEKCKSLFLPFWLLMAMTEGTKWFFVYYDEISS